MQRVAAAGKRLAFRDRLLKVNDVLQVGFLARRETLWSAFDYLGYSRSSGGSSSMSHEVLTKQQMSMSDESNVGTWFP